MVGYVNPLGITNWFGYDALGNLTKVSYDANTNRLATNILTYAYGKNNRLTTMLDSAGTTVYGICQWPAGERRRAVGR